MVTRVVVKDNVTDIEHKGVTPTPEEFRSLEYKKYTPSDRGSRTGPM